MADNEWVARMASGVTVVVDGIAYIIEQVGSQWATLIAPDGSIRRMTLRDIYPYLMRDDAPPLTPERLDDLEARLPEKAKARLQERRLVLRWYDTGLRPDQAHGDPVDPWHDPTRVPERKHRVRAMAVVIADRDGIKLESAKTYVRRTLKAGAGGDAGLVDPRVLKPNTLRNDAALEGTVRAFLDVRRNGSLITGQSMYTLFCAWLQNTGGEQPPAKRNFERALTGLYKRYPGLRQKAKTMASTLRHPAVAEQRRSAARVGEFWMIDSTASNVMLRDPYCVAGSERTFRLATTMLLEAASRYIVGWAVAEDANALSTSLALAHAFRSMIDEHDAIVFEGRTYPRPFVGLPRAISRYPVLPRRLLADNGSELVNRQALWNLHRFGIDCEALRAGDPRGKAPVERAFGSVDTGFDQLQLNYIGHSVDQRGEDSTDNVILTAELLVERQQAWIDSYNVTEHGGMRAQNVGRRLSPSGRWIELAEEHGVTEMPAWHNEWIRFLPNQVVTLNRYGVARKRLVYNAPVLGMMLDIDGAAPSGTVRIFYNPNDLRQVYCFDRDGNAWELPWVYRTDEVMPFSDFTLRWANGRVDGLTQTRDDHQALLRELVRTWQQEDVILLAQLPGKRNAEEILGRQLDAIRSMHVSAVIGADKFVGQNVIDAIHAANENLPPDEEEDPFLDDQEPDIDDLYAVFQ